MQGRTAHQPAAGRTTPAPADVFVFCSSLVTVVTVVIGYRTIVSLIANEFVVVVFDPKQGLHTGPRAAIGKPARLHGCCNIDKDICTLWSLCCG